MAYQQLITLLPCHSLDDFPFHLEGESADEVLSGYCALWHPALISSARTVPSWRRSELGEEVNWEGSLVTLPQICRNDMPGYFVDELRGAGATVIDCGEVGDERALIDRALQATDNQTEIVQEQVEDFLALGLCHLLTEVLTVRMRYSSLLDGDRFSNLLLSAADAAVEGRQDETREMLGRCYDALAEAKDHFYPVDTFLFDLTLIAPTTPARALVRALSDTSPINLMITADQLQRVIGEEPALIGTLKDAIASDRLCLVGGEYDEQAPLGIFSAEQLVAEFNRGHAVYDAILGEHPKIYGRRNFGLHPQMPQVLHKLGYIGALHQSLDGTRCPESYHGAISWQSIDGSSITALARLPMSAVDPESVLRLPRELGEAMDHDHVAAIGFAHYPGHTSPWYQRLKRIASFGSVLGKFVGLEACFRDAELMTGPTQFDADDYRTPYLRQAAAAGAASVSPMVANHRAQAKLRARGGLDLLAACVSGDMAADGEDGTESIFETLFQALPGQNDDAMKGVLLLNPSSQVNTTVVDLSCDQMPRLGDVVKAAAEADGRRQAVVEVPAMGFAWVVGDGKSWQSPTGKPLAEAHLLRNEFCEAHFHAESGALQSLHMPGRRGNLLSQRIAQRSSAPSTLSQGRYSDMVAETIEANTEGPFRARQTITGRLIDAEQTTVARFRQRVSISRGSPLIAFELELDPAEPPQGNPWQSYYGVRFAWTGDELFRGVGLVRQRSFRSRIESPDYLDLCSGDSVLTLLAGGIPYHTLVGPGQLDTILIPPGETSRQFSWQLGLQLPSPAEASWSTFTDSCPCIAEGSSRATASSAWLLHLSDPKVMVTHVDFVPDEENMRIRFRLLETGGSRSRLSLCCCRAIASARKLDFTFSLIESPVVQDDRVTLELGPGELCLLELEFVR
tara:strand:+ start:1313 stop:4036 length:2724 start_codon:yes stop_codon:yes gene_type:complete